jgi:hypothetical protein
MAANADVLVAEVTTPIRRRFEIGRAVEMGQASPSASIDRRKAGRLSGNDRRLRGRPGVFEYTGRRAITGDPQSRYCL